MIDKQVASVADAVAGTADGATVMIGGFGGAGQPNELIDALIAQGARDLTIVNNNAGNGETGLAALLKAGRVRKIICSFPRQADSQVFDGLYRSGRLELELVPQGNLAERIRAAEAADHHGRAVGRARDRVRHGRHLLVDHANPALYLSTRVKAARRTRGARSRRIALRGSGGR